MCMLHVINYVLTHPMAVTIVLTWDGRGGEDVSLIQLLESPIPPPLSQKIRTPLSRKRCTGCLKLDGEEKSEITGSGKKTDRRTDQRTNKAFLGVGYI